MLNLRLFIEFETLLWKCIQFSDDLDCLFELILCPYQLCWHRHGYKIDQRKRKRKGGEKKEGAEVFSLGEGKGGERKKERKNSRRVGGGGRGLERRDLKMKTMNLRLWGEQDLFIREIYLNNAIFGFIGQAIQEKRFLS